MGEFYCPQCGLHAPRRDYLVSEIDRASHRMTLRDPEGTHTYPMVSWSLHNAYNLAPVIALFRDMGVPVSSIWESILRMPTESRSYTGLLSLQSPTTG